MIKFVLLTRQRSGSTVIIRSLDAHPDIFSAGELFTNQLGVYHKEWQFPFIRMFSTGSYIDKIVNSIWGLIWTKIHLSNFFKTAGINYKVVGFKLMVNQMRLFRITTKWLIKKDIKPIILVRENPIEILVSYLKAKEIGVSHLRPEDPRSDKRLKINLSEVYAQLEKIEDDNSYLMKMAEKHNLLLMTYNEVFDWKGMILKLTKYLKVDDSVIICPVLKKRSKMSIKENITNYQELSKILKGTKYEKYLY